MFDFFMHYAERIKISIARVKRMNSKEKRAKANMILISSIKPLIFLYFIEIIIAVSIIQQFYKILEIDIDTYDEGCEINKFKRK